MHYDLIVKRLVINNSMRLKEILNEDADHSFSVRQKDNWTSPGNSEDYTPDIENWEYDVQHNGKVVGSIQYDDFFGNMIGDFGARSVEISKYADSSLYDENDMERYILSAVGGYFNSKRGNLHLEIMSRQQGLEALEEIKVTKTLAGKKSTPSRDLAMDQKKKSPNQGKKPVEIDKIPDAKDLATITLKGEYNQRNKK